MFINYDDIKSFFNERKSFGIKLGLGRMENLLDLLDNPQHNMTAIHVAGTNGKGSTINYIKDVLVSNSYEVGIFTSPSMYGLNGHILHNGHTISKAEFIALFNEIYPKVCQLDEAGDHPTEFEIITSMAFLYFKNRVDIALIETGMGGREDTTNCFQPIFSIITNISIDHTNFLGDSMEEIASHKSGVIKEKCPVIIGKMNNQAANIVQKEALEHTAEIFQLNKDFHYRNFKKINNKQQFEWGYGEHAIELEIQMYGKHQVENCSLALMALYLLKKSGFTICIDRAKKSLKNSIIAGRFEAVSQYPPIILDGAHNVAGVEAFLQIVKSNYNKMDKHLIFAGFRDKQMDIMLKQLSLTFESITLTSFNHSRAAEAFELYNVSNAKYKYIAKDWQDTISEILNNQASSTVYFITGSLYFITQVRHYILRMKSKNDK